MRDDWEVTQTRRGVGLGTVVLVSTLVSLIVAGGVQLLVRAMRTDGPAAAVEVVGSTAEAGRTAVRDRVVVPDLRGLSVAGARTAVAQASLLLRVQGIAPEGALDAQRITVQEPLPGSLLLTDGAVVVQIGGASIKPAPPIPSTPAGVATEPATPAPAPTAMIAVPVVTGLTLPAAREKLAGVGLVVGELQRQPSDKPDSSVLGQFPAANQQVAKGGKINLVLAKAGEGAEVPWVTRLKPRDARKKLERAGFRVREYEVFHPSIPSGLSIQTKPPAGKRAKAGSRVTLYIAE
jgi:beta-lactam-binding protein with PASTA domain